MRFTRSTGAALAASLLVLAACGSDDDDAVATGPRTPVETSSPETTVAEPVPTAPAPDTTSTTATTPPDEDGIDNCGVAVPVGAAPGRIVTMNQGATEIALALGFGQQMIGTAYLDDEILPDLAAAYDAIPVISDEYPSLESLLDLDPDFVYGSYASAFRDEAAGDRGALADLDIGTYLSPAACPNFRESGKPLTFDIVFQEFREIATIFGDPDAGDALVAEHQAIIDEAFSADFEDITVFWWDGGLDAPTVGACCGAPGLLMNAVGVTNIFSDLEGGWAEGSWEAVLDADPDVIVLADAEWDLAADKRAHAESDPALSALTAVQEGRFVVVPFSATTPGVRNAAAVNELATAIAAFGLTD